MLSIQIYRKAKYSSLKMANQARLSEDVKVRDPIIYIHKHLLGKLIVTCKCIFILKDKIQNTLSLVFHIPLFSLQNSCKWIILQSLENFIINSGCLLFSIWIYILFRNYIITTGYISGGASNNFFFKVTYEHKEEPTDLGCSNITLICCILSIFRQCFVYMCYFHG